MSMPTEKEVLKIKDCLLKGRHPAPYLRNCGMSYPMSDNDDLESRLPEMTVEELATYADLVTKSCAGDVDYAPLLGCNSRDLIQMLKQPKKPDMNLTAAANLAFVSLHGADASVRELSQRLLERWRQPQW